MTASKGHITCTLSLILIFIATLSYSQQYKITGQVLSPDGVGLEGASVLLLTSGRGEVTGRNGMFVFAGVDNGRYTLRVEYLGMEDKDINLEIDGADAEVRVEMIRSSVLLGNVSVEAESAAQFGMTHLNTVEGTAIYASKKSEVVLTDRLIANRAANVSRQVYSRVPGLNIWESDGAGIQLGIGGRGLSPNRSSNFNTRQNGYDISADALGYPESYYTPPVEAVERIEIVRGGASLQYGTQFGGMLNFRFRQGPENDKLHLVSRQTGGSFGFFSSFNSISGSTEKVNYYGFYQFKRSDGWRPNSGLNQHSGFASVSYRVSPRLTLRPEATIMRYTAQQPGGLTDAQFEQDPGQSNRERNWFKVDWNLFALTADYRLSDKTAFNTRLFGLVAGRDALGNLDPPNIADFGGNRDYISDDYRNWGFEARALHSYFINENPNAFLVGMRYYQGFTRRGQGDGSNGSGPDFYFLNPDNLEGSDFELPSRNVALFAENVFNLSKRLSVTPGIRFEYIHTAADGYYRELVTDLADNVIRDERIYESKIKDRTFVFFGLGASFRPNETVEIYSNISQNYRAINFNDIRVNVGNLIVDPDIEDERGFNADLGIRGRIDEILSFDLSVFYLRYNGRIGTILKTEPNPNFNNLVDRTVRFRTNIADARIYGTEAYGEISIPGLFGMDRTTYDLGIFANVAFIGAEYVNSAENGVEGNRVELVPEVNVKGGLSASYRNLRTAVQVGYVSDQFSDASNAVRTANGVEGIIPAYWVADLSIAYKVWKLQFEGGINNLTDNSYFTRRASGYPGPGIIPAEARSFYLTIGFSF